MEIFDVKTAGENFLQKMRGGVFALLHRLLSEKGHCKGGILIEFTFSIPVCIALLFFIHDHYRFYELQSKIRSSAYLAASMLQQIKNAKTDKQLTKYDFGRIAYASCLNFFHTNTMFYPYPFGIYYDVDFFYVKKISSDKYQYQQCYGSTGGDCTSPSGMNMNCKSISTKTSAEIDAIHPDLLCNNVGEERVLVECCYRRRYAAKFDKRQLGFLILNPKVTKAHDGTTYNFFIYDLVITPKPGLFPGKVE